MTEEFLTVAFTFLMVGAFVVLVLRLTARLAHAAGLNPPVWMTDPGVLRVRARLAVALVILAFSFFITPFFANVPFLDPLPKPNEVTP